MTSVVLAATGAKKCDEVIMEYMLVYHDYY